MPLRKNKGRKNRKTEKRRREEREQTKARKRKKDETMERREERIYLELVAPSRAECRGSTVALFIESEILAHRVLSISSRTRSFSTP
eukprot:1394715-Amorphochlora_amoeboformis.AAC.2